MELHPTPHERVDRPESTRRVWIDCTPTMRADIRTGIQRVVRNLIAHGPRSGEDCGAAVCAAGRWFSVSAQDSDQGSAPDSAAAGGRTAWGASPTLLRRRLGMSVGEQYVRPRDRDQFRAWFRQAVPQVDFIVADSRVWRDTIRGRLPVWLPGTSLEADKIEWFPLGVALGPTIVPPIGPPAFAS